jgi:transcriptional regulator with PAS, ATPase and Fis domain
MKYLLYLQSGFIKKFPLHQQESTLGRGDECDLIIDEAFISKIHAKINIFENCIEVRDLNSKNGIFVDTFKVDFARIKVDEHFRIGFIDFYLKEGETREFSLSKDVQKFVKRISKTQKDVHDETRQSPNLFDKTLLHTIQMGFKVQNIHNLFEKSIAPLSVIFKRGSLFLVQKEREKANILAEMQIKDNLKLELKTVLDSMDVFKGEILNHQLMGKSPLSLYSFPLTLNRNPGSLIFLNPGEQMISQKTIRFLRDFSQEISLIYRLIEGNRQKEMREGYGVEIITQDENMLNILEKSKRIAKSNIPVLIQGETGTGKELLAKYIHYFSHRDREKYLGLNCSAIPENLLEDELFGHEKGAFTGAIGLRKGKLELASGGTLVLDEIGDMTLNLQAKLLRVLQENEFYRVGGNIPIKVDLRVISITNKDIFKMIDDKKFREDLYFRIAPFILEIPPLRERKDDILPLIKYFTQRFSQQSHKKLGGYSKKALNLLENYGWQGNVRQLENVIHILVNIINSGELIDADLLENEMFFFKKDVSSDEFSKEKDELIKVLQKNRWNKQLAARELNYSRTTLYKKLKKFGIRY